MKTTHLPASLLVLGMITLLALCGVMVASGHVEAAVATGTLPALAVSSVFAIPAPPGSTKDALVDGLVAALTKNARPDKRVNLIGRQVLDVIGNRDPELAKHITESLADRGAIARNTAPVEVPALRTLRAIDPEAASKVAENHPGVKALLQRFDAADSAPVTRPAETESTIGKTASPATKPAAK